MNLHLLSFALSNSIPICQPMAKRRSKRSLCLDFHRFTDREIFASLLAAAAHDVGMEGTKGWEE